MHHLGPRAVRPANPHGPRRPRPRARRAPPSRARLRGRRLRAPRGAGRRRRPRPARAFRRPADARLPGPRRPRPGSPHPPRHRGEPLDPRLPGDASASSPPTGCGSIWNGAPLDEFAPVSRERALAVRRELGLGDDAPVVGAIGRLNTQKGHAYLLEAAPAVVAAHPSRPLPRRGRRRPHGAPPGAGARASASADRVRFAGHRADVPDMLGAIDVLAIPSLYEGTPLALFEAMAAGKAIVASAVDGCAEVLEDGAPRASSPPRPEGPRDGARLPSLGPRGAAPARSRGPRRLAAVRRRHLRRADAGPLRRGPRLRLAEQRPCRLGSSRRHAGEALEVPRDLLLGRYPDFVTGGPLPRGDVPVFVFHSVEPESFGRKLRHLADNGYVTLSARGIPPGPPRSPALPRQGRAPHLRRRARQPLERGGPLLRRHGMRGVVFLVPGRTPLASRPAASDPGRPAARPRHDRTRSWSAKRAKAPSSPGRRSRPSPARESWSSRATP